MQNVARLLARVTLATVALVLTVPACTGDDSAPAVPAHEHNPRGSGASATQTIGANGGTIGVGATTLEIPAGAVPPGTVISVTESTAPAPADKTAVTPLFAFSPEGLVFTAPVKVKMSYTGSTSNVSMFWSRLDDAKVHDPIGTSFENGVAIAMVTHFSSGFIGVIESGKSETCTPSACGTGPSSGQSCTTCSTACEYATALCMCSGGTWSCTTKQPSADSGTSCAASACPPAPESDASAPIDAGAADNDASVTSDAGTNGGDAGTCQVSACPLAESPEQTCQACGAGLSCGYPGASQCDCIGSVWACTSSADAGVADASPPSDASTDSGGSVDASSDASSGAGDADGASDAGSAADASVACGLPTFSPLPGSYVSSQDVSIATTCPNATIYFTTDGTNPTPASLVYTSPLPVTQPTTIRAFATSIGYSDSATAVGVFDVNVSQSTAAAVTFAPGGAEYNNPTRVALATTTSAATICYTVDGSTPTCSNGSCTGTAATYSTLIYVDAPVGGGTVTLKTLACRAALTDSAETTAVYSFRAAAPTGAPNPGAVTLNTMVTFSTLTATIGPNAVSMRYNVGGSSPSCGNAMYTIQGQTGVAYVTADTTFKVIACRPNYAPSIVSPFTYTLLP